MKNHDVTCGALGKTGYGKPVTVGLPYEADRLPIFPPKPTCRLRRNRSVFRLDPDPQGLTRKQAEEQGEG